VTGKGIGENADAMWRQLQKRQREVFGSRRAEIRTSDDTAEPVLDTTPAAIAPPAADAPAIVTQLLMLGACSDASRHGGPLLPPKLRINWRCSNTAK
jgi:hypothetical protein